MPRPPRTLVETVTANSRPQPAIPAVLVLCGLVAGAAVKGGDGSFAAWALTAGLLVSCGLAVAAGFCSVFPPLAWIGLAWLLFGAAAPALALHSRVALGAGTFAAVAMTVLQVWRIRTGKFVATIK